MSAQPATPSSFLGAIKKWTVAVPLALAAGAALSTVVQMSMDYGQLRSSLADGQKRITTLEGQLNDYRDANKKWSEGYNKLALELSEANQKVADMRSDQCEAIRIVGNKLQSSIENADLYQFSERKRDDLRDMFRQQQVTLQACLSARK